MFFADFLIFVSVCRFVVSGSFFTEKLLPDSLMCFFRVRLSTRVSVDFACHVYGIIRTFQCVLCSSGFWTRLLNSLCCLV